MADFPREGDWAGKPRLSYPTGATLWLACLLATAVIAATPEQNGSQSRLHKLRVSDPDVALWAEQSGGRLLADYGSFRILEVTSAIAETLTRIDRGEVRDDYNRVQLRAGVIDTSTSAAKAARRPVGRFAGRRLHLVQFAGPVQPAWQAALKQCGVEVVAYIPSNAYLLYGDADSLQRVQSWGGRSSVVQWDGPYQDEYKARPNALSANQPAVAAASSSEMYAIQLVADPEANRETSALIDSLKTAPIRNRYNILNYVNIIVSLPPDRIGEIANRPDVVSIQPYGTPRPVCERQCQIVAGNLSGDQPSGPGYLAWLGSVGFTQAQFSNSAFAVDLSDTGVDDGTTSPNHFGLYTLGKTKQPSRVIYNRLVGTPNPGSTIKGCDGHGTLDAHIIAGYDDTNAFPHVDSEGYHYGLGIAPFVRVGSSVIFDVIVNNGGVLTPLFTYPNYAELQSRAYHDGARLSSNSWGDQTNGFYSIDSQAYDALVRDAQPAGSTFPAAGNQEMVIVFAAGNIDFNTGASDIFAPGTAKNVITVGGSDNVQPYSPGDLSAFDLCFIYDDEAISADSIASFSCRGPTADGRMKPDLVAPATHISGGAIQAQSPGPNGTADSCFNFNTYQVCGGDALAELWPFYPDGQQFYTASSGTSHAAPAVSGAAALLRQYFINHGFSAPSPAMTKAWLMNSARYLTGVDANDDLWSPNQGMGGVNLGTAFDGVARILRDELSADKFTASGQTHSFAGTVANSSKPFLVTVAWTDAPGSTTGNAYNNDLDLTVTVNGQTYKGNVFVGQYSITGGTADPRNNAESVFLPAGVASNFTVTVTAANINSDGVPNDADPLDQDFALVVYNAQGGLSPDTAVLNAESCSPGNSVVDSGETVTVQLGLRNFGSANTTNLVATLLATGGVTSPSGPQTYGVLVAGGSAVVHPFTFTASGACGTTVTATLHLQDGTADLGTVEFNFTLGTPSPTSTTYSYSGSPVAIPDNNASGVDIPLAVTGFVGDITDLEFSIDGATCTDAAGATSNGINHNFVGDLILTLTSPGGTTVTLMNRPGPGDVGSSGHNFCHTVLDDQGGHPSIQSIQSTGSPPLGPPYTGTFAPYESLAVFRGEDPNGTWILNVSDNNQDDTGDVRAFSLLIHGHQCCAPGGGDTIGDGIPDSWRQQYFGSGTTTNRSSCASCDPDGDGLINLWEFQAGTDPTNSASAFRITGIARQGNDLRVTWTTGASKTNALQAAAGGGGGSYTTNNFADIFTVTNTIGTSTNFLDLNAATNSPARYYRIRLVP